MVSGKADVVPLSDFRVIGSVTEGSTLKTWSKATLICVLETLKPFRGRKAWFAMVFKNGQGLRSVMLSGLGT